MNPADPRSGPAVVAAASLADDRPIMVVGCPRSGTTLLRLMLNAHPSIAIPPETGFVLPAYFERRRFGNLGDQQNRRRLGEFLTSTQRFGFNNLGIEREAVIEAVIAGAPTVGSALAAVFRSYALRFQKPRWGDKRPLYIEHVNVLLRLFPNAQFIHMVRDGRDCVASLKDQTWYLGGTPEAIGIWNRAIDYGRRAVCTLPERQWHQLRYEDLVTNPEERLQDLCRFLGEEFHRAMLEPHLYGALAMPTGKALTGNLARRVTTTSIGRWADSLTPHESALMHTFSGRRLRALGYDAPLSKRPAVQDATRYLAADLLHRTKRAVNLQRDQMIRRHEAAASTTVAAAGLG